MELQELKDALASRPDAFAFREADGGLYIINRRFATEIHAAYAAIAANEWPTIESHTICGRDVQHITRVTGYFTIVEGWNRGKLAELNDRDHSQIRDEPDAVPCGGGGCRRT
jgi:hypothetical protein